MPLSAAPLPINGFVRVSDDEGLAHSDVRAIAQDPDGFIWFGLRLAGLTRYDGYELKVYQHDPGDPRTIGHQVIWSLLVDRKGRMWIGTEGGLDCFDRRTEAFTHYPYDPKRPDGLPHNVAVCLHEDARGRIWVGTRDGLARLDDEATGRFTTFRRPPLVARSSAPNTFRSILEDTATGLFWLGGSDGLAAFDPRTGAFASYVHDPADPQSLSRNAVNKIVRGADGVFWALTEFGLNRFRPTFDRVEADSVQSPRLAFRRYEQPATAAMPGINFLRDGLIDRDGRFWIGSRGGLLIFDPVTEEFTAFRRKPSDPTSISDDLTQALFEDRAGNLWIGTYSGGVNLLRAGAKPFHVYRHEPDNPRSLPEDGVSGLAFDRAGALWVATVNGLARFADGRWTRFMNDPADPFSLPANHLSTVAIAANGDVWVSTNYGGAFRFDGRRFHAFPVSPAPAPSGWHPFTGDQINSLLGDPRAGVWIGARANGVDYYNGERFLRFSPEGPPGRLPTTNAVFGFVDDEGALWFATEALGIVRLDRETHQLEAYQPRAERPGTVRSLHCLAPGRGTSIWVGAADGLLEFDRVQRKFIRMITAEHGLPHAAIMTIVPDQRGHLWLGTANGLADFDPQTGAVHAFTKPQGLPTNVFAQRAGALGPDGRVYLGTRAGLVVFKPEELTLDRTPPPVRLTELRRLGPSAAVPATARADSTLPPADLLRVPAGQLGFTLKFAALDFTAPEKNQYRYRLEGWDGGWSSAAARERSATYTALPPGRYAFRVQASNPDGTWNNDGVSLPIEVAPHVWQTAWFRIGVGVTFLGLAIGAVQWRSRAIRHRNLLLRQQVAERTERLQEEITEREHAEAELRRSHAELEQRVAARTAELAATNRSLQAEITERHHVEEQLRHSQKLEAIGQLAGGVAHDFNNLLTVIMGQSGLLRASPLDADSAAAVDEIYAAAQRAGNLTRQLLVFSRRQPMNQAPVELNALVAGLSKLLRHVIGETIRLDTRLYPRPLGVFADAGMLEQVLVNLAVNARDAMPRGGLLSIVTDAFDLDPAAAAQRGVPAGEYVRVTVADTGTGIPPEVRPHIFEPFFTTKETGKGTGLGLAITQGIVQQHQGWIDVDSTPGVGTTFRVVLPAHSLAAEVAGGAMASTPRATGGPKVLVVEDEEAVAMVVQQLLRVHGYRVLLARSADEALVLWPRHRDDISILLSDIVMPGSLDGHELSERLRREKPSLRVLLMSGYDPGEGRGGATADGLLRKPFTAEEVLQALQALR